MFEISGTPIRMVRSTAAIVLLFLAFGAAVASAQNFQTGGRDSGFNERDDVTGYLCVTPSCDVLRLPDASCICTKDNPNERRLERLKLTCSKREAGAWVACPVQPRYGN